jgi:flagellar motor protein MotB
VNKYLLAFAALAVSALVFTGCAVPQHKYIELKEQHGRLLEENKRLTEQNKDLVTQNEIQASRLKGEQARLAAAQGIINDMNREAPPEAPKTGWKTNPKTGGIVLENEIMFSAGSSRLSKKGKDTLRRLSALLNSDKYSGYFVRVDGHTDNVPVVKTIKENKDNWFLSARRAHAVLVELKGFGVAANRLFLAGYGQYHPIVPNRPVKKGTPANRRVEIVLVKEVKTEQ